MNRLEWVKPAKHSDMAMFRTRVSTNGQYKVVKYGRHWQAYFKPKGWKIFGNSCEKDFIGLSESYPTMTAAQKAAERHFEKFGEQPNPYNHILV